MTIKLGTKFLARAVGAAALLGAVCLAQAAITIIRADGWVCTSGTITVTGAVTPDDASCSEPPPPGNFTLTAAKSGTGTGTVTGTDASGTVISCGGDCSESYPDGTSINVTLTATANAGSTFAGWSGACTGTDTCTINQAITANLTATATFTADVVAGACGALPPNTVVVDTGNINAAWPQATFVVPPQQITAFKVTVPSGFTQRDNFLVAKSSSGVKSKLVVVSTCPGVLTPVGTGCSLSGTDTTTVRLSGKTSDPSYYCKLAPGVYYANAVSKNAVTDTSYNCSTATNCSFLASRGAPY